MDSSNQQPRILVPDFAMKPKRVKENEFGSGWTNEQVHFGTLDTSEDVVVVKELSSIVFFERRGWSFGQLHPIPFSRRIKGAICVTEEEIPSAQELRTISAAKYDADMKAKKEQESRRKEMAQERESLPVNSKEPIPEEPPESLKLSLLEGLYLSNDLGKLKILMESGSEDVLSPEDFFDYCCGKSDGVEFAIRYMAYRYYRRKGWVVKNGQTFGVTFVLYKSHPADYHSTYGVLVVSPLSPKPCNWRKMGGHCRELGVVSKGLIICTITSDLDSNIDLTLSDLDRFQVSEMHVKSWFVGRRYQPQPDQEATDLLIDDGN